MAFGARFGRSRSITRRVIPRQSLQRLGMVCTFLPSSNPSFLPQLPPSAPSNLLLLLLSNLGSPHYVLKAIKLTSLRERFWELRSTRRCEKGLRRRRPRPQPEPVRFKGEEGELRRSVTRGGRASRAAAAVAKTRIWSNPKLHAVTR